MSEQRAAYVVVEGVPRRLAYSYTFGELPIRVGSEVVVAVGNREVRGFVVAEGPLDAAIEELRLTYQAPASNARSRSSLAPTVSDQMNLFGETNSEPWQARRLKPVLAVADSFQSDQLPLFEWMAEYYGATLAEVIDNAVPRQSDGGERVLVKLTSAGTTLPGSAEDSFEGKLARAPAQVRLLSALRSAQGDSRPLVELESEVPGARQAAKALAKKGLVELSTSSAISTVGLPGISATHERQFQSPAPSSLTPGQSAALELIDEALDTREFQPILLHGVTGSGKTEVYIRAIERVLTEGGSALVIVPEISLTPQFLDQLQSRLNTPLALLHSQVGATERWRAWREILDGKLRVAIGARSAIFAPLANLRLVIVDEEHENSYKQSDGLRYNGRDVAVMRAKFSRSTVILGSATPSFESLLNSSKNRYKLIEMPDRVTSRPPPGLEIVDLSKVKLSEMPTPGISPQLHQAISETLMKQGQVVILYNRRGFSSYLQCESCSEVVLCPNCSVSLTFHRGRSQLVCHYCDYKIHPPTNCRFCRDPRRSRIELDERGEPLESARVTEEVGKLVFRGSGTEQIVDELVSLFPSAKIVRMDRDAVTHKGAYRRILGDMRSGRADILVGTQMIAKGHDLPGVTLVGIVDADIGLHLPDFRASEKAFQLITQAAGRAGRGKEQGRVIVQTREPNHPTIVATVTGRFRAFARYELEHRKQLNYPPWGRLLRVVISSTSREEAFVAAQKTRQVLDILVAKLRTAVVASKTQGNYQQAAPASGASILGPARAPHERLRGRYRWHLLVKSSSAREISQLANSLNAWARSEKSLKGILKDVRLAVDVDPVDML